MPHSAPQPESNVSRDEMRAALARGGARPPRRAPLNGYDAPVWDWSGETEAEVQDLREEISRLEAQLDRERSEQRLARAREDELRMGLRALASVSVFRRRRVVAELAARRLLPPR